MHGEAHWAVILIPATLLSVANECEVLHAKSYSLLSCSATEDWVNKPFWQVFIASRLMGTLVLLYAEHPLPDPDIVRANKKKAAWGPSPAPPIRRHFSRHVHRAPEKGARNSVLNAQWATTGF